MKCSVWSLWMSQKHTTICIFCVCVLFSGCWFKSQFALHPRKWVRLCLNDAFEDKRPCELLCLRQTLKDELYWSSVECNCVVSVCVCVCCNTLRRSAGWRAGSADRQEMSGYVKVGRRAGLQTLCSLFSSWRVSIDRLVWSERFDRPPRRLDLPSLISKKKRSACVYHSQTALPLMTIGTVSIKTVLLFVSYPCYWLACLC